MYLKALEIQGFKSFPDKTVLSFDEDITAIVGPNGSGKSNISDAIRWVMGEQSTRALRGGKMEDVIFGGTLKRKQMGYAQVTLILDNTKHIFDREESEVMVTRRYYRSGESEYFINKTSCRLRDVNELFMDTGLGREGYSIIGQGKIDEILSQKSADRRQIFEEAAGISRYRHRKEEAERKLEHAADNLLRVSDKIEELELQVEPLREQAEKAKQYLIYRDELRGLEISVWMEQLDRLREGNRKLIADYENAVQDRDEAAQAQQTLYARAEELAGQMHQQEVEVERLRAELSAMDLRAGEQESDLAVLRSDLKNQAENAERLSREMDQQGGRAESVQGQIADRETRLEEIRVRRESLNADLAARRREVEENRSRAGDVAQEMEALRQKESMRNASAGDARALLSALAAAQQELLDRETTLKAQRQDSLSRLETAQAESKDKQKQLDEAREERDSVQNMIDGYQLRAQSRRQRLEKAEDRAMKLTMDENALQSRIHMLSEMEKLYEGYSKAVKAVMQAAQHGRLQHIHGPVAGLVKVPDRYTVAIEIALGGAMQNLVVDREEDGKAAIQYLKQRDAGRATFLPLSSIRPNELREQGLDRQRGFVGVASDLVEYAPVYAPVFANLLGRVVIAEDMDSAIAIARNYRYHFRIVTLDGQVLNPGGSMTGGSVSRSAGILSRGNELERLKQQSDGLRQQLAEAKQAAEDAKRDVTASNYELEVAESQKREWEDKVLKLEGEMGQYEILLSGLRRGAEQSEEEQSQLKTRLAKTEEDIAAARGRIQELEGEAEALRAEAEGKASGEAAIRARAEALAEAVAQLNLELAALDAEESTARQAMEELQRLQAELELDQGHRREMIAQYGEKSEALRQEILEKERALEAHRTARAQQETRIQDLAKSRMELEAQRVNADREAREKNAELLDLERDCSRLEQKKLSAEMEEKQLLDKLWETYELSHSDAQQQRQELESLQKATRRIGELKRAINGLGNVNLGAVEEFQRVNERYTYLVDQRTDVEKAKAELEGIISSITDKMEEIFAQQFQLISEAFAQTFQELFRGGRAALELEDPEDVLNCGIEIRVQPPGKSLKVISLLSGGEKAFVAIALYFAILKVRPTPFVVMDEIEAALDDANVTRFAHYMRTMTGNTQFIVVTHRRGTMEEADILYGVTMQEQGVSRVLTINLNDVEKELHIK